MGVCMGVVLCTSVTMKHDPVSSVDGADLCDTKIKTGVLSTLADCDTNILYI